MIALDVQMTPFSYFLTIFVPRLQVTGYVRDINDNVIIL